MIISFSGAPGSGKSTIAKRLAKKLGWPRYYMGSIMREKAKQKGMTLKKYIKLCETDSSVDLEVDEYQRELGQAEDNFIIEGRTSYHFIPDSIKIYLDVSGKEGAVRVFKELQKSKSRRNEDKNLVSIKDVLASHQERKRRDKERYKKYFNTDIFSQKNYDFILDTTKLNEDQVFTKVYEYIKQFLPKTDN